jgi:hypothetical protein
MMPIVNDQEIGRSLEELENSDEWLEKRKQEITKKLEQLASTPHWLSVIDVLVEHNYFPPKCVALLVRQFNNLLTLGTANNAEISQWKSIVDELCEGAIASECFVKDVISWAAKHEPELFQEVPENAQREMLEVYWATGNSPTKLPQQQQTTWLEIAFDEFPKRQRLVKSTLQKLFKKEVKIGAKTYGTFSSDFNSYEFSDYRFTSGNTVLHLHKLILCNVSYKILAIKEWPKSLGFYMQFFRFVYGLPIQATDEKVFAEVYKFGLELECKNLDSEMIHQLEQSGLCASQYMRLAQKLKTGMVFDFCRNKVIAQWEQINDPSARSLFMD